ncbi:hypothetical protein DPEC_G00032750 [Dallia pectoralis]|uniref:Uncharacterized protein n=1 Tax=Dallia pectoralis TaxID=75939 RepID=A0ACC2HCJ8_DALPE|nr:hypothetical protein DPEC_G00032750 [Dallia pectoralis]
MRVDLSHCPGWLPRQHSGVLSLKWELNITSHTKKAQKRQYCLRQFKKYKLPTTMTFNAYTAIIESILTSSITVGYAAATVKVKDRLLPIIRSAERTIGCKLTSITDLFKTRSLRRAAKIEADPSHPGNGLFRTLPSGRWLQSTKIKTSRHKKASSPRRMPTVSTVDNITHATGICSRMLSSW